MVKYDHITYTHNTIMQVLVPVIESLYFSGDTQSLPPGSVTLRTMCDTCTHACMHTWKYTFIDTGVKAREKKYTRTRTHVHDTIHTA